MAMSDEETLARVSLTPSYKIYYDIKSICNVSRTIPQSDAVTDQRMEKERAMCEEQPPTKPIHLDIRLRLLGAIPEEVEDLEPALSEILASWRRPTLAQLMSDRLRAACHGHMTDEEQVKCLIILKRLSVTSTIFRCKTSWTDARWRVSQRTQFKPLQTSFDLLVANSSCAQILRTFLCGKNCHRDVDKYTCPCQRSSNQP